MEFYKGRFLVLILAFCISSCAVVTSRQLSEMPTPPLKNQTKTIFVNFDSNIGHSERDEIMRVLRDSKLFNIIEAEPLKKSPDNEQVNSFDDLFYQTDPTIPWDYKMEIAFQSYHARNMHPTLCIITVGVIPCFSTMRWDVSVRIKDRKNQILKEYFVKEDGRMIIWLFGFFLKRSGSIEEKNIEVFQIAFNHIFSQMAEDKLL